jgi:hypothetical protein
MILCQDECWNMGGHVTGRTAVDVQDYVRHSQQQLPALAKAPRDQPFTNIIWALACWEYKPPQPWLQEFCRSGV